MGLDMKKLLYLLIFIAIAVMAWKYGAMKPNIANGWQTINKDGVSVAHPDSLILAEAMEPYYFLPNVIASLYTDKASYKPMNYSQDGRVIVSFANIDEQACYTAPEVGSDKVFDETAAMNGKNWKYISFSDAGAGNRYETKLYRLAQNGICYEIAESLHYASDWNEIDMDAATRSQQEMRAILKSVVETVKVQ